MNVNQAAFCTTTALAVATGVSVFAAATTAATVAVVAYSILAVTLSAVSMASITAWIQTREQSVNEYFNAVKEHTGYCVAGAYQFVSQILVQALVQGLVNGISKAISRKIAGEDVTIRVS